jgi:hypothetical protein
MSRFSVVVLAMLATGPAWAQDPAAYNICERFPEFCSPTPEAQAIMSNRSLEFNLCEFWPESCNIHEVSALADQPRHMDFCRLAPESCVLADPVGLQDYLIDLIQGDR